jgi:hypothetical protein
MVDQSDLLELSEFPTNVHDFQGYAYGSSPWYREQIITTVVAKNCVHVKIESKSKLDYTNKHN